MEKETREKRLLITTDIMLKYFRYLDREKTGKRMNIARKDMMVYLIR
jgi:hypothetical protein